MVAKNKNARSNKDSNAFVIRRLSSLTEDVHYETPLYWSESGYGWHKSPSEGTRYTLEQSTRKLGELLHEEKIIGELVDVTVPYESPVKLGTVVVKGTKAFMVMKVPQVKGDTLTLSSPGSNVETTIQGFLESITENDFEVIWDPERGLVPEDNDDYLEAHGFVSSNGEVKE